MDTGGPAVLRVSSDQLAAQVWLLLPGRHRLLRGRCGRGLGYEDKWRVAGGVFEVAFYFTMRMSVKCVIGVD